MKLGYKIREIRLAAGLTQYDLAQLMGVSPGTVSNIELERSRFAYPTILKFCAAMKLPFVQLVAAATEYKDLPGSYRSKYSGKFYKVKVVIESKSKK